MAEGLIAEVKMLLAERVGELVAHCAPGGKLAHGYWIARNPTRGDANPGSFWIVVARPGKTPGAWKDEATGDKGDILDLVAYTQRLDRKAALAWSRDWLGHKTMAPTAIAQARAEAGRRQAEATRIAAYQAEENAKRAFGTYVASTRCKFETTPAARYLLSRGIDVRALSRVPGALGFLPRVQHTETRTFWPVMVAGLQDDGGVKAIHRTFLSPDGSAKAAVTPVRKVWPSVKGLTIRLWRGETEMSTAEAARHGLLDTLVICEGVEDGLSIALARPDLRVWAAYSLGNIAEIRLPQCAHRVIVAADNDWGKPQAEAQLNRALAALAAQGREVRVARSPIGKDFNDCLQGAA